MSRILDNQDKKTAGQLIHMLKKHVRVSAGIETALAEGLGARNVIIHRVLADNIEMLIKADTRATLLKEICRLRRLVRKADAVLQPVIIGFSEALDGVEQAKVEADCRTLFS